MNEIDYNMMDKFVEEKNHLIINALSKDDFEKCHIPDSVNMSLLSLKRMSKKKYKGENHE